MTYNVTLDVGQQISTLKLQPPFFQNYTNFEIIPKLIYYDQILAGGQWNIKGLH